MEWRGGELGNKNGPLFWVGCPRKFVYISAPLVVFIIVFFVAVLSMLGRLFSKETLHLS